MTPRYKISYNLTFAFIVLLVIHFLFEKFHLKRSVVKLLSPFHVCLHCEITAVSSEVTDIDSSESFSEIQNQKKCVIQNAFNIRHIMLFQSQEMLYEHD